MYNHKMGSDGSANTYRQTDGRVDGWMDGARRSTANHGLTEEDARDRDMKRNLVVGKDRLQNTVQLLG